MSRATPPPPRKMSWQDPDPNYDPLTSRPCGECSMVVGFRNGVLNRHALTPPLSTMPRPEYLRSDGWCRGGA